MHFILERRDYLLGSFNKSQLIKEYLTSAFFSEKERTICQESFNESQMTKDYLPNAFHLRKKGLTAKETLINPRGKITYKRHFNPRKERINYQRNLIDPRTKD